MTGNALKHTLSWTVTLAGPRSKSHSQGPAGTQRHQRGRLFLLLALLAREGWQPPPAVITPLLLPPQSFSTLQPTAGAGSTELCHGKEKGTVQVDFVLALHLVWYHNELRVHLKPNF